MADHEPIELTTGPNSRKEPRPWGFVEHLATGPGFKVLRLSVKPGAELPLFWHRHRDENWVVVRGTARVYSDDSEQVLGRGQSVYIPRNSTHGLTNVSSIDPVEVLEAQTGDYIGDDDEVPGEGRVRSRTTR